MVCKKGSSAGIYIHIAYTSSFFCTFGADLYAQSVLLTKFVRGSSVGSLIKRARCWLGGKERERERPEQVGGGCFQEVANAFLNLTLTFFFPRKSFGFDASSPPSTANSFGSVHNLPWRGTDRLWQPSLTSFPPVFQMESLSLSLFLYSKCLSLSLPLSPGKDQRDMKMCVVFFFEKMFLTFWYLQEDARSGASKKPF